MFRFSIRDLFWLTLVAGMAVAMYLEHRRVVAAEVRADDAGKEGLKWRDELLMWKGHVATIQEDLSRFEMGIVWFGQEEPTVMHMPSKGTDVMPESPVANQER